MDRVKIINEITPCKCRQIANLAHEVNQSLLVIKAYVSGCEERLKEKNLDNDQLTVILKKISQNTDAISNKIHRIL